MQVKDAAARQLQTPRQSPAILAVRTAIRDASRHIVFDAVNRVLPRFPPRLPVILAFHSIPDRAVFQQQMELLRRLGKPITPLAQLASAVHSGGPLPASSVVLTFDDGYVNQGDNAAPILHDLGWPATFFVATGCLGGQSVWEKEQADEAALPLMDRSQVRELAASGFEVGCHSHSHPHLSKVDAGQLDREISQARSELEQLLGAEVPGYCYPYGDAPAQAREAVRACGYAYAVGTARHAIGPTVDCWRLPRMSPPERAILPEFQAYVSGTVIRWLAIRRRLRRTRTGSR